MKKLLVILCSAFVLVSVPAISGAFLEPTPFPDANDCAQSGLGATPVRFGQGSDMLDRFAICVTDGVSSNGAELYIGGERHPEHPTTGACSAVVVGGRTISGDPDWNHVVPGDPTNTSDDVLHDCQ